MADSEELYHLAYVSAATPGFDLADLDAVLKVAREHNAAADISGMLLFEGASFLQVLEGQLSVIDPLMERIRTDPRHANTVLLLREQIEERSFSDWTMGYTEVSFGELREATGLNDFFRDHSSFTDLDDDKLRRILGLFREGAFRQRLQ
jgi:hypothetical protein